MSLKFFGIEVSRWSQAAESAFSEGMSLVRTDCTDEEIRDVIIDAAHGETSAMEGALAQVESMRCGPQTYVTDRALRVFDAAARGTPVAPVDPASAELFKRERRLENLPLEAAVAELCELSPALKGYCENVRRQGDGQYEKTGLRQLIAIERGMEREIERLVGPGSDVREPLVKSPIAGGVARTWIREKAGLTRAIKQFTDDG
jgi:hypothetical protein